MILEQPIGSTKGNKSQTSIYLEDKLVFADFVSTFKKQIHSCSIVIYEDLSKSTGALHITSSQWH